MIENKSVVQFPRWVKPPTPCETRTFSIVLTGVDPAGAIRHELRFTAGETELFDGVLYYAYSGHILPGEIEKLYALRRRNVRRRKAF